MKNKSIVAIDPSIRSTAVNINGQLYVYTRPDEAKTAKGELRLWYKRVEKIVEFRYYDTPNHEDHSTNENLKFDIYTQIAEDVTKDIQQHQCSSNIQLVMEGFSYDSVVGPLIDLVTLSTLIKKSIRDSYNENIIFKIIPPLTLKKKSAMLTYDALMDEMKKSKKPIYRNFDGKAGAHFTKHDMLKAITQNKIFDDPWSNFLREYEVDLLTMKSLPKPIDDVNDAYLLYKILEGGI